MKLPEPSAKLHNSLVYPVINSLRIEMSSGTSATVTGDGKVESLVPGIDVISLYTGRADGGDPDLNPPTLSSESLFQV